MTVLLTLDLFTGNDGGIIIRVLDAKPAISQASCWRLPALQFLQASNYVKYKQTSYYYMYAYNCNPRGTGWCGAVGCTSDS